MAQPEFKDVCEIETVKIDLNEDIEEIDTWKQQCLKRMIVKALTQIHSSDNLTEEGKRGREMTK